MWPFGRKQVTASNLWRYGMLELTKKHPTEGMVEICLRVPTRDSDRFMTAVRDLVAKAGEQLRPVNDEGEPLYSVEEVFPDRSPGKMLVGARYREDLTQQQLADLTGIPRRHISEIENNRRTIGKERARRLAQALRVDYRVFL